MCYDGSPVLMPSMGGTMVPAVVGIITRHPMKEDDLIETLKQFSPREVSATLSELEKSSKV